MNPCLSVTGYEAKRDYISSTTAREKGKQIEKEKRDRMYPGLQSEALLLTRALLLLSLVGTVL